MPGRDLHWSRALANVESDEIGFVVHDVEFFFCIEAPAAEIYTLSLHDALPICRSGPDRSCPRSPSPSTSTRGASGPSPTSSHRSEEHTSELQSRLHLVCRLLLEKKKQIPAAPIRHSVFMTETDPLSRATHSVHT